MSDVTYQDHDAGLTWVCGDALTRSSHAVAVDGRVWLIDPVDDAQALERAAALGTPAAVVQLLDRHPRDCARIAARLGVPHLRLPGAMPGSPFEVIKVLDRPGWRERALWWAETRTLVVAEVVGTNDIYTVGSGSCGIHPMLRLLPPGAVRAYQPEHLLVGHGPSLHGPDAARGVEYAYSRSRRDLPRFVAHLPAIAKRTGGRL